MKSFVIANDWAHVRRKFVEAAPDFPVASEMVDLIGELFEIERRAKRALNLKDARDKLRSENSLPILEKIRKWMQNNAGGWQGSNLNRADQIHRQKMGETRLFCDASRSALA